MTWFDLWETIKRTQNTHDTTNPYMDVRNQDQALEIDHTGLANFPGSAVLFNNTPEEKGAGNLLTFGVAGDFEEIEAVLLILLAREFMKTKEGQANLTSIINTYLKSCTQVIESLNHSGTQNYVNNIVNQYVSIGLFQRLGFMSAKDALTTKIYLDHIVDLMYKKDIFGTALDSVTTMVDASARSERGQGMYAADTSAKGLLALLGGIK